MANRKALEITLIVIGILAPLVAIVIKWLSVAVLEDYGIIFDQFLDLFNAKKWQWN